MLKTILFMGALFHGAPVVANELKQQACVTEAIYHEAANQPELGRALVYHSIKNRAADSHWKPDTPCGVVWQKYQYSFTLWSPEKRLRHKMQAPWAYEAINQQVKDIWKTTDPVGFEGVNHYLRCDIRYKVKWWRSMEFLGRVGDHCFYRGY